jgi:hypothetical protein
VGSRPLGVEFAGCRPSAFLTANSVEDRGAAAEGRRMRARQVQWVYGSGRVVGFWGGSPHVRRRFDRQSDEGAGFARN